MDKKQCLNLGAGSDIKQPNSKEVWLNVDKFGLKGIDKIMDLDDDIWSFPDNYFDYIFAHHVLEHVNEPLHFLREAYRILKPEGSIEIHVPHKGSCAAFHLAHKNYFSMSGFNILESCKQKYYDYEIGGRFRITHRKLSVINKISWFNIPVKIISYYEWFFPASEIEVILQKVKK